jgi:hypothetical protein
MTKQETQILIREFVRITTVLDNLMLWMINPFEVGIEDVW